MASSLLAALVVGIALTSRVARGDVEPAFPDGFLIGAATAAYQIEGAWNVSDKGENVWDWWTHNEPWRIRDLSNGDVACDSYHKYGQDIRLAQELGADFYRFSLSWSRILPTGFANVVSKDGIAYYRTIIDGLLAKGIEPFVTIYHWDHPEVIERMGGWTNEAIVEWFGDYARVVFRELGPRIKYFATINEPSVVCEEGYGNITKAPGKNLGKIGSYRCMHNVLKAHARAYHIYQEEFRAQQNGQLSIVIPCSGYFAKNSQDINAEDVLYQFQCGWIANPIFSKTGDYPDVMKTRIADNSRLEGYPESILPEFSSDWIEYIKGTADFFALNHYTSLIVKTVPKQNGTSWFNYCGVQTSVDPKWPKSASTWLRVVPDGFRQILRKIKDTYDNPPVYVLENGFSDFGSLVDDARISYLYSYLKSMLTALHKDGCDVRAYTVWSLLDNFEWNNGYAERFGIVHVDFGSPERTRTPKLSMTWLQEVLRNRKLRPPYNSLISVNMS